ncbi:biotin synthase [Francisella halioticida]|uniref:Biotin synthase n=1 Tax=Francisella halioticida TaxID=549298 RepID=A0ABM6M124_9GAMM|nr:methyltransferase domain-containing protein [Francisella halioticida]ASG68601.1 biotin synthase [Francisella halioticida]
MFNYNLFLHHLSNRRVYQTSFIKNEIAQRLLKRLDFIKLNPIVILVEGYQDSNYLKTLKNRFSNAKIYSNQNSQQKFDIIISNSTIHLTDNLTQELENYYELLNNDGILLFSTFGNKSFASIKQAFAAVSNNKHTNDMIDLLTWGDTLQSSRYKNPAIESDLIIFTYESTSTLFEDIRALNEPLADTTMHKGLTGKKLWNNFNTQFKQNLQLEIEALYGYAIRKNDDSLKPHTNPNRVSLDELKDQIANFKKTNNT